MGAESSRSVDVVRRAARAAAAGLLVPFVLLQIRAMDHRPPASTFAFESTAVGTTTPTRWPACAIVHFVVDLRNAPKNASAVLSRNLRVVHSITGITFVAAGTTTQTAFDSYDESGAVVPVVFAWLGPRQLLGQSSVNAVTIPIVNATRTNYTSAVVLFNDDMNAAFEADPKFADNLVLHELGHVLGLANVDDSSQVMNYYLQPRTTVDAYASGDTAGLHWLYPGAQDCVHVSTTRVSGVAHNRVQPNGLIQQGIYRSALSKEQQWE